MTKITPTLVHELHGSSAKTRLARCLEQVRVAWNDDIVAVRQVGLIEEYVPYTNAYTFLVKTNGGFEERRLCDLPGHMQNDAAVVIGVLEDDWELLEDIDDAAPSALCDRNPCRWFEMLKFRDGVVFMRLPRPCGMYDTVSTEEPDGASAFLFIEGEANEPASKEASDETTALIDLSSWILDRRLPGLLTSRAEA